MNASDNPLIRARTPFDRRTQALIASAKPRPVSGAYQTLPGGTFFESPRSSSAQQCAHQWRPRIVGRDGDDSLVSINSGYFRGQSPCIGNSDDTLEEDPELTLAMPVSGISYAYLRADIQRVVSNEASFVVDGQVTDLRVVCTTGVQIDSDNSGLYRRWYLLFTKNGSFFTQHRFWNIGVIIDDDGTGSLTPRFHDYTASS